MVLHIRSNLEIKERDKRTSKQVGTHESKRGRKRKAKAAASPKDRWLLMFVCLLQNASGQSNVLKAGKAEELKNARKRRTARKAY